LFTDLQRSIKVFDGVPAWHEGVGHPVGIACIRTDTHVLYRDSIEKFPSGLDRSRMNAAILASMPTSPADRPTIAP
jgi:hypothetical protein